MLLFEYKTENLVIVTILSIGDKKDLFQVTFGAREHIENEYLDRIRNIAKINNWISVVL